MTRTCSRTPILGIVERLSIQTHSKEWRTTSVAMACIERFRWDEFRTLFLSGEPAELSHGEDTSVPRYSRCQMEIGHNRMDQVGKILIPELHGP